MGVKDPLGGLVERQFQFLRENHALVIYQDQSTLPQQAGQLKTDPSVRPTTPFSGLPSDMVGSLPECRFLSFRGQMIIRVMKSDQPLKALPQHGTPNKIRL